MQTTHEHPHATLVRRGLEAFNRGEVEGFAEIVADDVVWHEIGGAEPIRGKQAMADSMAGPDVDYEIKTDVHDVVANGEHTIALVKATATRKGKTFEYRTAEILHIHDGKIAERWAFSDDTEAINRFFA